MSHRFALALALLPLAPACRMVAHDPGLPAPEENLLLPGDRLRLTRADGSASEVVVGDDGALALDDATSVETTGQSAAQLSARLADEGWVERLEVVALAPSIDVRGSVERAGRTALTSGDVTVFEAVMKAAPTAEADLAHVRLFRGTDPDPLRLTVNLKAMLERGDTTANVQVRDGDRIVVPATLVGALLPGAGGPPPAR